MAIKRTWKIGTLLALSLLCSSTLAQPGQAVEYEIDSSASQVFWRVYSAGALSRLGHNHVISAPALNGAIHLRQQLEQSEFVLEIPVISLIVDDPALRAELGEGFSGNPSVDDIAGTRRNMLSARLLDAEQHPVLRISGTGPHGEVDAQTITLVVEIAGASAEVVVPGSIIIDGSYISAEGNFTLSHHDLGLRPFSALLGTLRVAEEMEFTYRIVARRMD